MNTRADIAEAQRQFRLHLVAMVKLAKVDESKALPGDMEVVNELLNAPNGKVIDELLQRKELDGPFRRGVIYFGERNG